jgi:hypothetical protein
VEEYVRQRRQRVLIIDPAALRDRPWTKFLDDRQLYAELAGDLLTRHRLYRRPPLQGLTHRDELIDEQEADSPPLICPPP